MTDTATTRRTPGPWTIEGPDQFGDYNIHHPADRLAIGAVVSNLRPAEEVAANAAFIVQACNAHPALVEALADIELQWLPYSDADLEAFASMRSKDCGKVPPHWAEMILAARKALALARAALNGIPQPATSTALDGGKKP